jgi:polysaccharide deacetylase family protein (PEP-CTERM system associated)
VDVEDYFMVEAFTGSVSRTDWDGFPSRVVANTHRILDLFEEHKVHATFFFLGWIAERFPRLVREVGDRGHELACHSYWHRPVYSLTPREFRDDTRRAKCIIEQSIGASISGYRAPTWSITRDSLWALDILSEEGFSYDSSIYPIYHDLYGIPGANPFSYTHHSSSGAKLREIPPATVRLAGFSLPAAGGGYLRILPRAYTRWAFRQFESDYRQPVVVYFHPWEIDPHQPHIHDKILSRFRHYTNLTKMHSRLCFILRNYLFNSFQEFFALERARSISLDAQPAQRFEAPGSASISSSRVVKKGLVRIGDSDVYTNVGTPNRIGRRTKSLVLAYHELGLRDIQYLYSLPCELFEEHLQLLSRFREHSGAETPRLEITFDDGHASAFQCGLIILHKYSVRATFFVSAGLIGKSKDLMTWPQLRELVSDGHRVQSHGWSHKLLTHCSQSELERELLRSKLTIEDQLGISVNSLSVPGGRWNRRVLKACADFDYKEVYTSNVWERSKNKDGITIIGRMMVTRDTRGTQIQSHLKGGPASALPLRARLFGQEMLRGLLGDQRYIELWRVLAKQRGSKQQTVSRDFEA